MSPSGPPDPGSTISYTAIGASDASGYGSSGLCFGIDGPSCMGYVSVAARRLRTQGFTVTVRNLGIPTAAISARFQQLGQQHGILILGNFIDNEAHLVSPGTTAVSIFAGANDVNVIRGALGAGAGGSSPNAYIDQQVAAFAADYLVLIDTVRTNAPGARIFLLNVPNLGALPYLANASLTSRQQAQRISVGMSTAVNARGGSGVIVVDLMCEPALYLPANLASDGFHPNDSGYALIAEKVAAAIPAAAYPAPAASCAPMTIVS